MTRAEAATQAARALSEMMRLAVVMGSPDIRSMYDLGAIVDEEARAKLDLAAALLVLTDPADAIDRFMNSSFRDTSVTKGIEVDLLPRRLVPTFYCECGLKFPSAAAREVHWQEKNARDCSWRPS